MSPLKNDGTMIHYYWIFIYLLGIIEAKYVPKIFLNIEDILPVNNKLLTQLESRINDNWNDNQLIGDIFVDMVF